MEGFKCHDVSSLVISSSLMKPKFSQRANTVNMDIV